MKRYVLFAVCLVCVAVVHAQYCSLQEGRKLHYEKVWDGGEKRAETYTFVIRVETWGNSTFVTLGSLFPKMNGQATDSLSYQKVVCAGGNTLVYLQDEDTEMANIGSMLSGALGENELASAKDKIKMEGQIRLLLNKGMKKEEKIAPCKLKTKIGPLAITTSIKGKYQGFETLSTPAGKFDCLKVSYTMKVKFMFFSETCEITEWYAENVGLVKHEETGGKAGSRLVETLSKVEAPSL